MINAKQFDTFFMAALVLLGGVFIYTTHDDRLTTQAEQIEVVVKDKHNPFDDVNVVAPSVMVYDIRDDKVLFARNEDERMALASLTKLMSAIIVKEAVDPEEVVYITPDAIELEGDNGLLVNEAWHAHDLLALTLVASSNDGTRAFRNHIQNTQENDLVDLMNQKAKELGLTNTYFINESGLDVNEKISGGYGSASDVVKLLTYAYKNHTEVLKQTKEEELVLSSLNYGEHVVENTNKVAGNIPSLVISKTGFTDIAGGNLAVVFEKEPRHPIAVVVLGSTIDNRFSDVEQLVWAAIEK